MDENSPDHATGISLGIAAPMDSLPSIDAASSMRWTERISLEMMGFDRPFYGINIVDVRKENYAALYENIQTQQKYVARVNGHLHFYTVTEHQDILRITWINLYEPIEQAAQRSGDTNFKIEMGPNFRKTWTEFGRLAEGFAWWVSKTTVESFNG